MVNNEPDRTIHSKHASGPRDDPSALQDALDTMASHAIKKATKSNRSSSKQKKSKKWYASFHCLNTYPLPLIAVSFVLLCLNKSLYCRSQLMSFLLSMLYTKLDISEFGDYQDHSACYLVLDLLDQLERKAFHLVICEVKVIIIIHS